MFLSMLMLFCVITFSEVSLQTSIGQCAKNRVGLPQTSRRDPESLLATRLVLEKLLTLRTKGSPGHFEAFNGPTCKPLLKFIWALTVFRKTKICHIQLWL